MVVGESDAEGGTLTSYVTDIAHKNWVTSEVGLFPIPWDYSSSLYCSKAMRTN